MLRVFLFGSARIEAGGRALALRRSKSLALLAYLAVTGAPQDRDALLALLWPEFDGERARNNLRRELSLLRAALGAEVLSADRQQIAWSPQVPYWLDVAAFNEHLAEAERAGPASPAGANALAAAVALAGDELLAGFSLPDSPAFDEWLFFQREAISQQLAGALQRLARWHGDQGDYGQAIGYARRWLALDQLHEPAQRELMRLYARSGQYTAALRQYEACARLLEQELGLTPEPETEELYAAIKARRFPEPSAEPRVPPVAPAAIARTPAAAERRPVSNLPPPLGGFIGRERELADIIRRLTDPACRLLTLVGPGGIGKTRLALRVARTLASEWADAATPDGARGPFADGILFVPLASLTHADQLAGAIAAAAGLDGPGALPPREQLFDYLRERQMLIVLDNFEHLLDPAPGGAEPAALFISELLLAAPGLRLLVTSREALNLQDEWFHAVAGLSFPTEDDDAAPLATLARYDAVRLLEQHARRIRSDFSLSREREHAVRLCRLVEGMPLAIELAASWLKLLSVEQIVVALEQNLDILTTRDRDINERHRSMRTVLDETWRLLSATERRTLAALSVCRGGFSAEAAEAIAGASLATMATLVDKALLRADAEGRFQLHELLRQFAAEQLAQDEELQRAARERHSAYYLDLVSREEARLQSPEQRAALATITRESGNLQAAWRWASETGEFALIDRALRSCYLYFHARSAFKEGDELFSTVGAAGPGLANGDDPAPGARLATRLLIRRGAFRYYLGDYEGAIELIDRGLPAAERLALQSEIACAQLILGAIAAWRGDYRAAQEQLEAGLALGRACGDQQTVVEALHHLAKISGAYGDYVQLRRLAQEGLRVARAVGQPDWMARALRMGSVAATYSEEYAEAERYAQEAQTLAESINDRFGVAMAFSLHGWIARCRGELQRAEQAILRSLEIVRALGHRPELADNLADLALIAIDSGDTRSARSYSDEGLRLARELNNTFYLSQHLCIQGHLAASDHEFATSRRLFAEALRLTAASHLWTQQAFALYHLAGLLAEEAAALGGEQAIARQERALELLAAVASHPATWPIYRARARRLSEQLRQALPSARADAAIARGERFDWQASVASLVAELGQRPSV